MPEAGFGQSVRAPGCSGGTLQAADHAVMVAGIAAFNLDTCKSISNCSAPQGLAKAPPVGMAMGTIPYGDTYNIPIPIYSLSSHPHPRLHDWG